MTWTEDFSASVLADVIRCQAENIAWAKQLRAERRAAIAQRLSNQITFDKYQAIKYASKCSLAEYERRRVILLRVLLQWEPKPKRLACGFA